MVSREIVDFNAVVGEFGEFSEEACEAFWHNVSVFVPEVEHVSEQVNCACFMLDAVEEAHESALLHPLMGDCERSEVCVGDEIDVIHNFQLSIVN